MYNNNKKGSKGSISAKKGSENTENRSLLKESIKTLPFSTFTTFQYVKHYLFKFVKGLKTVS